MIRHFRSAILILLLLLLCLPCLILPVSAEADAFADHLPTITADGVTQHGNWETVVGSFSGDIRTTAFPTFTRIGAFTKREAKNVATCANALAPEGYRFNTIESSAYPYRISAPLPSAGFSCGVLWRAPQSGVVSFDVSNVRALRDNNITYSEARTLALYFTIVKNDTVIWPSDGHSIRWESTNGSAAQKATVNFATSLTAATTADPFPVLYMNQGDEISFLVNAGNETVDFSYIAPSVTYLDDTEATAPATLHMTLTDSFALTVSPDASQTTAFTDLRAELTGTANKTAAVPGDNGSVCLGGFTATTLTDPVLYRLYGKINGNTVLVEQKQFSPAAYLRALCADGTQSDATKDLAYALLAYAKEAQTYFGVTADDPTAGVTPRNMSAYAGTAEDAYDQVAEDLPLFFGGVSLSLDERVMFLLYPEKITDALAAGFGLAGDGHKAPLPDAGDLVLLSEHDGYTLRFPIRKGKDGRLYAVVDVPLAAFDTAYTFRVADRATGQTVYSTTLTYSVSSYIAHNTKRAKDGLLDAIRVAGLAANAYLAEEVNA